MILIICATIKVEISCDFQLEISSIMIMNKIKSMEAAEKMGRNDSSSMQTECSQYGILSTKDITDGGK